MWQSGHAKFWLNLKGAPCPITMRDALPLPEANADSTESARRSFRSSSLNTRRSTRTWIPPAGIFPGPSDSFRSMISSPTTTLKNPSFLMFSIDSTTFSRGCVGRGNVTRTFNSVPAAASRSRRADSTVLTESRVIIRPQLRQYVRPTRAKRSLR